MAELRVYLCALSNPVRSRIHYEDLIPIFARSGITLEISRLLDRDVTPAQKAEDFNKALRSGRYAWIADVSGGDLANEVLPYLDYEAYWAGNTYYAGFSDCTCVVNALAVCARKKALLFPLWNQTDFRQAISIFKGRPVHLQLKPVMGSEYCPRHARISGGNLRCFLKLAGTVYMPWVSGGLLVLESMSTDWNAFRSMAAHLQQSGGLDGIRGIVLGRFNKIEERFGGRLEAAEKMIRFLRPMCPENIGWYLADTLGHIPDSSGIWISPQPAREDVLAAEVRDLERTILSQTQNPPKKSGPWNTAAGSSQMPVVPQGIRVYQPNSHAPGPLPSSRTAPSITKKKAAPIEMRHAPVREEEDDYDDDSLFDFDPDMTAELLVRQWSREETPAPSERKESGGPWPYGKDRNPRKGGK